MRKPSVFLLILLLIALAHAEIPELIQLTDNPTNDFGWTTYGRQSVQSSGIIKKEAPVVSDAFFRTLEAPTLQGSPSSPTVPPAKLDGQDILLLCSVLRT